MILSDVTIRKELAAGRIVIDPLDESAIQPSSVDLRIDRYFRVFRNDTTPFIDPKEPQEDLTELVEVYDERAFILHPGRVRLGFDARTGRVAGRHRRPDRGKVFARATRVAHAQHRRLRRQRLGRPSHARVVERRDAADRDLPEDEDRPDLVLEDDDSRRPSLRQRRRRARSTRASGARHRLATT